MLERHRVLAPKRGTAANSAHSYRTCDNFPYPAPLNLRDPLLRIKEKTVHLP